MDAVATATKILAISRETSAKMLRGTRKSTVVDSSGAFSSIDTLYISYQALALDAFRKIVVRPQLGSSVAHLLHIGCVAVPKPCKVR